MERFIFAFLNIKDKIKKVINNPALIGFYLQIYIFSRFKKKKPHIYIVSYPKCGRTWLRMMLQKYSDNIGLSRKIYSDKTILGLPDGRTIKFEHDQGSWVPAPPMIKNLKFNVSKYSGKKVVFLVRDPRDILVSSWYHLKFRENIYRKNLSAFIRDELVGIHKVVSYMNMWCESKDIPDHFFLLRYEDLHANTELTFQGLLLFLNIPVNKKNISHAIKECSFANMKKMETDGAYREPWMKPGTKKLEHSMKIRKGKIGGFKDELSKADIEHVNSIIDNKLNKLLSYIEV
ncbi:MAG: sulfotransferase domain-containing protein [Deltaproteobacteria bacterium]|jgi:hypothetical protein|nr:sulfotransferase domain-containing protein [Deltaproteobacteria bacterium]